ncbi:MAG TPA: TolC family protein [Pirellulales bacterium]|nr:TolC family protein [Pirellulales bacterium]
MERTGVVLRRPPSACTALAWVLAISACWQAALPAHAQPPADDLPLGMRRQILALPKNLPGAAAPEIRLPPYNPEHPEIRIGAVDKLFPPLPPLPPPIYPVPGPSERPVALTDLENLAIGSSPVIRQAQAQITAAHGHAIQVGTAPNPTIGYEADTVGSSRNPNYQGAFFNQWVKTAGKLQLAQAAAMIDVRNAQLALRRDRIGLITQVQGRYYAVLVAEEGVRIMDALVRFTEAAYRIQVEQLRGGEAAAYEPMQLRVLAMQARGALVQARNRYFAAWNQLAATVNSPNLPPAQLAGSLNVAIPALRYDLLRQAVWERHPDILAARNSEQQARINLRFEEVVPIPDLYLYGALQKDYTVGSPGASFNTQVGMPIPFFDKNRGGIMEAQGLLIKAAQQIPRVRNDLTVTLADSFERYMDNRAVLEFYRSQILPDQARAYRGTFERHQQQPDRVGFGDVVIAQQTYSTAIASYLLSLGNQWTAVTDLLNVVQVEDLLELENLERSLPPGEQGPVVTNTGEPVPLPPAAPGALPSIPPPVATPNQPAANGPALAPPPTPPAR